MPTRIESTWGLGLSIARALPRRDQFWPLGTKEWRPEVLYHREAVALGGFEQFEGVLG